MRTRALEGKVFEDNVQVYRYFLWGASQVVLSERGE